MRGDTIASKRASRASGTGGGRSGSSFFQAPNYPPRVDKMSADPTNPGSNMAAAVDAEVAKFRALQTEIQELRSSQQTLIGQQNENEMVKQELDLLDEDSATVYKMVGPVLMKNDLDDAKQTVEKRLEYITGEL